MDFLEAIRRIEERGDFNRYADVKPAIDAELAKLKRKDHTQRGLCYYYLLVSYLKAQLVHETEESIDFFWKMDHEFLKQEEEYLRGTGAAKEEVQDFYRLMNRCYNSLEFLYLRHDFKTRKDQAYKRKMRFRQNGYYHKKKYGRWLEYKLLEITSLYGSSLTRWALTTLSFVFVCSLLYMGLDATAAEQDRMIPKTGHWFDYFYFSVIILTTVGLGDITPITFLGKLLVSVEAFSGFLILGVFLGMIHKKL